MTLTMFLGARGWLDAVFGKAQPTPTTNGTNDHNQDEIISTISRRIETTTDSDDSGNTINRNNFSKHYDVFLLPYTDEPPRVVHRFGNASEPEVPSSSLHALEYPCD